MARADRGVGDLAPGQAALLEVDGQSVAVVNVGDTLFAYNDRCTHAGCSLSDGLLEGAVVTCPCHGSQFDVTTGAVIRGPAQTALAIYEVELMDGSLRVKAASDESATREARDVAAGALAGVPLFSELSSAALDTLEALAFRRTFSPGEVIIEEGRTGNGLYVILSGTVEVVTGLASDQPRVLATLGAGEPFGEMALLGDWKRAASVRVIEQTRCVGIDRWVFLAYLRREPDLAINMLQFLARRLAETNQRLRA